MLWSLLILFLVLLVAKNSTNLFFRGKRVWEAVMHELLSKGLANAKQVIQLWILHISQCVFLHSCHKRYKHLGQSRNVIEGMILVCDFSLQALLTGCSAGGLATFIHCDDFQALLPKQTTVKCLPDAGFFLNAYVSFLSLIFLTEGWLVLSVTNIISR